MKPCLLIPLAALALASCSSSPPPPPLVFAPLDYSYLPPIILKVSYLTVTNSYVPTPDAATLVAEDPEPPAVALLAMLNHRLVASGAPGTATVTVQNASISRQGNTLAGAMTVDVNVDSPNGATGFAEASVSASQTAPDPSATQDDVRSALYHLTKQLMDAMNVQLQYQIQHNMSSWISYGSTPGIAPLAPTFPGAIQASPLAAPAQLTPPPSTPPLNTNPAVPSYLPGTGPSALQP